MKKVLIALPFLIAVAAAVYWLLKKVQREQASSSGIAVERRAVPDPLALQAITYGDPMRMGIDVERLRELGADAPEPLIEYLTYIQVQRGDSQSLVFVRQADLDSLAQATDTTREDFVEQLQQLGVMLSMN